MTWITRVNTIKWHTRAAYGCLVIGKSPVAAGLRPIGCTLDLSVVLYKCYAFSRSPGGCSTVNRQFLSQIRYLHQASNIG